MESPLGARMQIGGRSVDYFCGTSYFCLHGHQDVINAACEATRQYGLGAGTLARMPVYEDLHQRLRKWFATDDVVTLISGYSAPAALLQGLRDDFDVVFVDEGTHYSTRDALAALVKPIFRFRHLDPESLELTLSRNLKKGQRALIATDGVFPSSGALAPLSEYRHVMNAYGDCLLFVDDSHGVGVLGPTGQGSLQIAELGQRGNYVAGTLSKAFGSLGGFLPVDNSVAQKVREKAMILRGASLPPPSAAAAAIAAMQILETQPIMRANLARNVRHIRHGLRQLGFAIDESPVPIISVRGDIDMEHLRSELARRDIIVKITPPRGYSDAPDAPTLRLAVFSQHTTHQIDNLLSQMRSVL